MATDPNLRPTDPRAEHDGNVRPIDWATVATGLYHALPRVEKRLGTVETTLSVLVRTVDDMAAAMRGLRERPSSRPTQRRHDSPLPSSAEETLNGSRVVMSRQEAVELQNLVKRIQWWRGTARDAAWGAAKMAAKWGAAIGGTWLVHSAYLWWQAHR
jgi:hypothetical protein